MGEEKRALKAGFRKRRNVESVERLWPMKIKSRWHKNPNSILRLWIHDYDVEKLKSEVEAEG